LYFSGFSLENESNIFASFLQKSEVIASGFSYGAIKLIESILNDIEKNEHLHKRIDKIQLFSPAFFNDKDKKYKRMQLMFFQKDSATYCDNFLKNCGFSLEEKEKYFQMGTYEELEELLHYNWSEEKMYLLLKKTSLSKLF